MHEMWNDIHNYFDCGLLFQRDRKSFDVAIKMRDTPMLIGNGSYGRVCTSDSASGEG